MRHPTDGTLRRLVDEPAGVADADREHVANCPQCLAGLAAAQQDAARVAAALHHEVTGLEVDAAWQRLSRATTAGRPQQMTPARTRRWRTALRSPVLAVVAALALVTGATAAAANNWLQIFHTERIAPVTLPEVDLASLPELSSFGELEVTGDPKVHRVADAATAQRETGLAVPQVGGAVPQGVTGEPAYLVGGQASAVFTFSAAKTAEFVKAAGGTMPTPPAGLDGNQFRMTAGPGVAVVWAQDRPVPAMIIARAKAPTVYSSGVSFATARDYLLSLPGMPASVASQLRTFTADGTTLPVPVPADQMTSSAADVGGVPATVISSRDGIMAGVVWVDGGVVTAVAGSLSADEVLSVARGLRWDR